MPDWTGEGFATADQFREMAVRGYADRSPTYRTLALRVAADDALLSRLDALPPAKRQPNLVFAAARYLNAPIADADAFVEWCRERWGDVEAVVQTHRTQTNEARRCTALLPALTAVPGPLALIEVGASAGLCLQPDRYAYRYTGDGDDVVVGRSPVTLSCSVSGSVPLPAALPEVVWRHGLDLDPLDVTSDADVSWLRSLVWPEQTDRLEVLAGAISLARADPPPILRGDLLVDLPALVHEAPAGVTVVVYHSAVLAYLGAADRRRFVASLAELGRDVVWISNETPGIVVEHADGGAGRFLLARDGQPLAWAEQHGYTLAWL